MSIYHSIAGFTLSALMYGVMLFAALEPVSLEKDPRFEIAAPAAASPAVA